MPDGSMATSAPPQLHHSSAQPPSPLWQPLAPEQPVLLPASADQELGASTTAKAHAAPASRDSCMATPSPAQKHHGTALPPSPLWQPLAPSQPLHPPAYEDPGQGASAMAKALAAPASLQDRQARQSLQFLDTADIATSRAASTSHREALRASLAERLQNRQGCCVKHGSTMSQNEARLLSLLKKLSSTRMCLANTKSQTPDVSEDEASLDEDASYASDNSD